MAQAWWGDFRFEAGGSRCWHLAGLDLRVSRNEREWQVETLRSAMQHEDEQEWSLDEPSLLPLEAASPGRHLFDRTGPLLRLLPALGRPIRGDQAGQSFIYSRRTVGGDFCQHAAVGATAG